MKLLKFKKRIEIDKTKGHDNAPMLICMLPRWIKKILLRRKAESEVRLWQI